MDPTNPQFTQGYLSPQPGLDEETNPFEPCKAPQARKEADESNTLFALKRPFLDQLEETEDESLRSRQEFFMQKEEDGICLNFTSPIKLKNGHTQLNLV